MTREEAIEKLKLYDNYFYGIWRRKDKKYRNVFDVAIEALQAEAVQGCDGCRYNTRIPQKQCLCCKRYWRDRYERKGGDTK